MSQPEEKTTARGGALTEVEYEAMLLGRHLSLATGRDRRREGHLDRSAYTLLSRLELSPMSISELSTVLGLDTSTLNRQTGALTRAGLVDRIPDPSGRLARKFQIRPEGQQRLDQERQQNVEAMARVLREWSSEEVADLAGILARFNQSIELLNGRVWDRP